VHVDAATELYVSVAAQPGRFGATVYNRLFERHRLNKVYLPRCAEDAAEVVAAVKTLGIRGCSVSMPLKTAVMRFLSEIEPLASAARSVNTIVNDGERLVGYNTDVAGARHVFARLGAKRILVYGAGSVVGSLILGARAEGDPEVTLLARRPEQAKGLARRHGVHAVSRPADLNGGYDLLVNATPASNGDEGSELFGLVDRVGAVFDLVVSSDETRLVRAARACGLRTVPGIDMAIAQLLRQFELYCGFVPDEGDVREIVDKRYRHAA
jgi:shikimate dehydrogenase